MVTQDQDQWKGFKQHFLAQEIVNGLELIPEHWALTPVQGKRPYRNNWQEEIPLSKDEIRKLIIQGEKAKNKKGKDYCRYASGYGVRLGEVSGGLIAIDIDGSSAEQLLKAIVEEKIPNTPTWTSNKKGRYQVIFQVPESRKEELTTFTRRTISTWNGSSCEQGEQIEIRYQGHQSVLPCSYHPETEQYHWIVTPTECEVAIAPEWLIKLATGELKNPTQYTIPLINCLSKNNQEAVSSGAKEGERNNTAIKIALDAVGCEEWLGKNKYAYSGDTAKILEAFNSHCNPPLSAQELTQIYDSAKKHSKGSAIGENQLKKVVHKIEETGEEVGLKQKIDNILALELHGSELSLALTELSRESKQPYKHIAELYEQRNQELELEEEREQRKAELDDILAREAEDFDIAEILPEALAIPIKKMANWLGLRPIAFATTLLCGVSALHHPDTEIILNEAWGFTVKPNLFGAIVAESSQKKSPILNSMMLKPLNKLQKQWKEDYIKAEKEYKAAYKEWVKGEQNPENEPTAPQQKIPYFTNATAEGLAKKASEVPEQGMMYFRDELAGLFKDLNKYSKGKGSELEDLLSFYDGTGGCNLRVNGVSASFHNVLLGLFGSIQPEVLKNLISDFDDPRGLWGRFLLVQQPISPSFMESDGGSINIDELIFSLYEKINENKLPEPYRLEKQAFEQFRDFYNWCEKKRTQYNTPPGVRALYGKAEGRVGKIALNLHAIQYAMSESEDNKIISLETMKAAIALNHFFISQTLAIRGELNNEDQGTNLSGLLPKVIRIAERKGDTISASEVNQSLSKNERESAEKIKEKFRELEQLGYGETIGGNRTLKFKLGKLGNPTEDQTKPECTEAEVTEANLGKIGQPYSPVREQSLRLTVGQDSSLMKNGSNTLTLATEDKIDQETKEVTQPPCNQGKSTLATENKIDQEPPLNLAKSIEKGFPIEYRDWINQINLISEVKDIEYNQKGEIAKIQIINDKKIDSFQVKKLWNKEQELIYWKTKNSN